MTILLIYWDICISFCVLLRCQIMFVFSIKKIAATRWWKDVGFKNLDGFKILLILPNNKKEGYQYLELTKGVQKYSTFNNIKVQ